MKKFLIPAQYLLISTGIFIIACFYCYPLGSKTNGIAFRMGELFAYGLVSAIFSLILTSLFRKEKISKRAVFSTVFFIVTIVYSIIIFKEGYQSIKEMYEAKSAMQATLSIVRNPQNPIDSTKTDYGPLTPGLKIIQQNRQEIGKYWSDLQKEIENYHMDSMIASQNFQNQPQIDDTLNKLKDVYGVFDKYENLFTESLKRTEMKVDQVEMPKDYKDDFVNGFEKSKEESMKILSGYFSVEKATVLTSEDFLNFIKQKQGQFKLNGEQISFVLQSDADKYNNFMAEFSKEGQQETVVLKEMQGYMQTKIYQAENLIKQSP